MSRLARATAIVALLAMTTAPAVAGRFGGGGGFARPSGGFDFHGDASAPHPQTYSHSSTGPEGTQRTTTAASGPNGYSRSTTATNGGYSRTSGGSASSNGNYNHYSNTNTPYGNQHSSTNGNYNSGNYNHSGSGSNGYGSYSDSGSGNSHYGTYSGSGTATNAWGQTYHSSTYANNGVVYHGATVTNPVYGGYGAWGWNSGIAWYPAPYYWGGGFWGAFAIGAVSAATYGAIVANNTTYNSYQVQASSPGEKLLSSYHLTQTPCGPSGLVVIYGPNNSVICAKPNDLVSAGNYSLNSQTLTITSQNPS